MESSRRTRQGPEARFPSWVLAREENTVKFRRFGVVYPSPSWDSGSGKGEEAKGLDSAENERVEHFSGWRGWPRGGQGG